MIRVTLVALLLLFGIVQPIFAQNSSDPSIEVLNLLQKIAAAPRQHNYIGTFIYSSGHYIETSRIVHMLNQDGEHEKIEILDGSPREIIRNNDEMQCYLPESKTIVAESNLNDNYIISKGEPERISDYECQVIVLEPKDDMRYGHRLWVDPHTGLLLKAAVVDKGHVVEQFVFTQLKIGGEIDKEMLKSKYFAETAGWRTTNLISSTMENKKLGWQVNNPPAGFKKIIEMKRNLSGKPTPVRHIALSDGLAAVSVFIEPMEKNSPPPAQGLFPGYGAINIYARIVADNMVTTVGEVPPATVMQIGNSVINYKVK
jgi:sigma-E factor negative regulatory protein RseB